MSASARNFTFIETNGVVLRVVVEGEGPLVIMSHGWPQCWYLWRHLIDPVVTAGYRVAVPDMRGFGASSCPPLVEDYTIRMLTADVAGIAEALGEDRFISVGHDWGCVVAWYTALSYPERCRAVLGMSVPFWRIGESTVYPPGQDDAMWYIRHFVENPERAAAELDADPERTIAGIHHGLTAEAGQTAFFRQLELPRDGQLLDGFPRPPALPRCMTQDDLSYYTRQFRMSGFRGGLNWYRNMPTLAASTPELQDKNISQPAGFLCGAEDPTLLFDEEWRPKFESSFDDLRLLEIVPEAGHWVQLEQPRLTAEHVLGFLKSVDGG